MKNSLIKIIIPACLLISLLPVSSQAEIGKWKYYRAYQNVTGIAETPHLIFAVYDGSLLSYNPDDKEIKLYSAQTGLSDVNIQYMAYSPQANALVLVYENANIDIFAGENEIYNISFIKDNNAFQNKTIYNLEIIGKYAYISTGFGIVVVDIDRKEVKNSYKLDVITRSVCIWDDYLLAATDDGIKKAAISSNLVDKTNWKPFEYNLFASYDNPGVKKILVFKGHFVFHIWDGVAYSVENHQYCKGLVNNIRQMTVLNDQLVVTTDENIYFYSDFDQVQQLSLNVRAIDCYNPANRYWVGLPDEGGLAAIDKKDNAAGYEWVVEGVKVNSPKRNLNFSMTFTAGKLLIAGGGKNTNRLNTDGTLMVYENGQWTNFDEKQIARNAGIPFCMDFVSVAVDPRNTNRYFVGSWGEGLYEFVDNQFVKRYNHLNTNGKIQSPYPDTDNYSRITALVFDRNQNLFMANADVHNGNGLVELSADGNWKNYYIQPLAVAPHPDKILIDRNNYKWLNIWSAPASSQFGSGIIVLDADNQMIGASDKFYDQNETDIGAATYLCMAEESNGTIWVGTDNGPITISSPQQLKERVGKCARIISTDQYGYPFYPLEREKINVITIDGGDRKWLGSDNSGIFLVEQSGGETRIENFNTSNSPILSNRINSIAINDETGEVFIGTANGLCSYMSHVTSGKSNFSPEVHAFPNPVRPATDTQVSITGLMQNSIVKITDTAGNLINQGRSAGSLYTWNCANRSGEIVKAGIYLVFAASSDGSQGIVTKIMVIK
jgi:ligand-binding sensor domain-containing protein